MNQIIKFYYTIAKLGTQNQFSKLQNTHIQGLNTAAIIIIVTGILMQPFFSFYELPRDISIYAPLSFSLILVGHYLHWYKFAQGITFFNIVGCSIFLNYLYGDATNGKVLLFILPIVALFLYEKSWPFFVALLFFVIGFFSLSFISFKGIYQLDPFVTNVFQMINGLIAISITFGLVYVYKKEILAVKDNARSLLHSLEKNHQELEEKNHQIESITNAMPVCIAYLDRQMRFQFVNKLYEHWFSMRQEEIVGKTLEDVIGQKSIQMAGESIEKCLNGETITYEAKMTIKNAGKKIVRVNLVPNIVNDEVTGLFNYVEDITDIRRKESDLQAINNILEQEVKDRRNIEKDLQLNRKRLAEAQRVAVIGSWQIDFTKKEMDVHWSEQMYRIFEIPKNTKITFKKFNSYIYKKYRMQILAQMNDFIQRGKSGQYVYPIQVDSGEVKWLENKFIIIKDDKGIVTGIHGTLQDITERKEYERAIKESEQFFRSLFEESPIAIAFCTSDGTIERVNPKFCELMDYTQDRIVDSKISSYTLKEDLEIEQQMFTLLQENPNEICNYEKQIGTRLEGDKWVQTALSAIVDEDQNLKYALMMMIDITEQKQKAAQTQLHLEELKKVNKELDQFAYIVSHDLKAPLRGISTLISFVEEDLEGEMPTDVQENFDLIKGRINRMGNLINGILTYSRIGRKDGSFEEINLDVLVRELVDFVNMKQKLSVQIHQNLPIIYSSKIGLQQIFQNLLSNAIKYNDKPECQIDIYYEDIGLYHQFAIKDNGPGISPEYHERIFGIFQTLQGRDEIESTGVGLSIVKKRVEAMQGKVWIESIKGEGACFYFTVKKEALERAKEIGEQRKKLNTQATH